MLINAIKFYQKIPGNFHYQCRFQPTCSNYALKALEEHNLVKAILLIIYRLLRCNPFSKGGFDPVPKKKGRKK